MKSELEQRIEQYSLQCEETTVYYWVSGQQNRGPFVVFTHGASLDHHMFDKQVMALASAGYPMLTWDIRGHGISKPMGKSFSVDTVSQDLLAILVHLGAHQVVLVGHSFGGYVSQHFTSRYPHRVVGLVVIGSTDINSPPAWGRRILFRCLPLILSLIPDNVLRRAYANQMGLTQEVKDYAFDSTQLLSRQEFITAYAAAVRALVGDLIHKDYTIPVPFLLTHGSEDAVDSGRIGQMSAAWLDREPLGQYQVIPRAGHIANLDNSDSFNKMLMSFLEEIPKAHADPAV